MPALTEHLNIKFFISDVIITVIHRRIRHEILRGYANRIERFKTIRAIQAQNILQNLCHSILLKHQPWGAIHKLLSGCSQHQLLRHHTHLNTANQIMA